MSLPYSYPEDYELFAIGKILRRKAAYNAYERHGGVDYAPLEGFALLQEDCLKAVEESGEVVQGHNEWQFEGNTPQLRRALIGELGDLSDVMARLRQSLKGSFVGIQTAGNFNMVLPRWKQIAERVRLQKEEEISFAAIAENVSYTENAISRYLTQWSISRTELDEVRAEKDETKGSLLPGRVEYLTLPKGDDWIPHMRERFKTASFDKMPSIPPVHPHLLPVTPQG